MGMFDGTSAQEMQDRIWEFEEFQTYIKQEGNYPGERDSDRQCKRRYAQSLRGIY